MSSDAPQAPFHHMIPPDNPPAHFPPPTVLLSPDDVASLASQVAGYMLGQPGGPPGSLDVGALAAQVASQLNANPAIVHPAGRQRRATYTCPKVQRVLTRILKAGVGISKLSDIGSDQQLSLAGSVDNPVLDDDDESYWSFNWSDINHSDNQVNLGKLQAETRNDAFIKDLLRRGDITEEDLSDISLNQLLRATFASARASFKAHTDETGERLRKKQEHKEQNKKNERRKSLATARAAAAATRTWDGKSIPVEFFDAGYHSDSERDANPDISDIEPPINRAYYRELRGGAGLEMLSPSWRNDEFTRMFHQLSDWGHSDRGSRPRLSRYYHETTRRLKVDQIPDGIPRCMLKESVYLHTMDDAKRALVRPSPPGW